MPGGSFVADDRRYRMSPDQHVVIVGGGFSGTLLAINLLRHDGPRATLIERSDDQLGAGVAYSASQPSQLLNVRATGMSAFPDDPEHFTRWLQANGGGGGFVPRATYGAYLRELLAEAIERSDGRLAIRRGEACDVEAGAVVMADGERIACDAVVLAIGNLPPHLPAGLDPAGLPPRVFRNDPWAADAIEELRDDDTLLLLGTGLTAIDVALKLDAGGFGGRIVALSRRGLAPRRHVEGAPPPKGRTDTPDGTLSQLVREVRERAETEGWRAAVDALRPVTQRIWAASDRATRARFLRHLRPFWDVHRHRLAPAVADKIDAMTASGRLRFLGGKVQAVEPEGEASLVRWRPRHEDAATAMRVDRIVNCTGPQGDLTRSDEPLLRRLLDKGAIRPDALRLGLDADAQSHAIGRDGEPREALYCIGPMTRGGLWEVVAVPDLRRQSWELARQLSNAQWVGGEGL